MLTKIITAILQFLDDTFRNMRCYSRCCQSSSSNTDVSIEDEPPHQHHRQRTLDSQISNHSLQSHHSHHSHHSSDKDDLEKAL